MVALAGPTAELTPDQVVAAMAGRSVDDFYPKDVNVREDGAALVLKNLTIAGALDNISLAVKPGEVLPSYSHAQYSAMCRRRAAQGIFV